MPIQSNTRKQLYPCIQISMHTDTCYSALYLDAMPILNIINSLTNVPTSIKKEQLNLQTLAFVVSSSIIIYVNYSACKTPCAAFFFREIKSSQPFKATNANHKRLAYSMTFLSLSLSLFLMRLSIHLHLYLDSIVVPS